MMRAIFGLIMFGLFAMKSIYSTLFCLVENSNGTIDGVYYDEHQFLCCNKTLVNKTVDGQRRECCDRTGGVWEPYSADTHICCGVYLEKKKNKDGERYRCCSSTNKLFIPVNKPGEECCGNSGNCCDNIYYDPFKFFCCHDKLKELKNDTEADVCPPIVRKSTDSQHSSKCEGISCQTREKNEKICCNGHLSSSHNEFVMCVNTTLYNPETRECCPDNGKKVSWEHSCCEASRLTCPQTLKRNVDRDINLCSGQVLDPLNEQCCGDKILKKSQKCCGGKELSSDYVCCERSAQYGQNQEKMIHKKHKTDNQCCVGYGGKRTPFNKYRQQCFHGDVMDQISMCGSQPFDESKDLCCKNTKLHVGKKNNFTCCLSKFEAYDQNQFCCQGIVYNKTDKRKSCGDIPTTRASALSHSSCILCDGQSNNTRLRKKIRKNVNVYIIRVKSVRKKEKGYSTLLKLRISPLKINFSTRLTVSYSCRCVPQRGTKIILYSKRKLPTLGQSGLKPKAIERKLKKFVASLTLRRS